MTLAKGRPPGNGNFVLPLRGQDACPTCEPGRAKLTLPRFSGKEGCIIPNTRSAKKELRKNLGRRAQGEKRKSAIRHFRREIQRLLAQGEWEKAQELFPQFQRAVDKAAARRVIHPRRAARLKARLHGRIKAV